MKLVRSRIPEVIERSGCRATTHLAQPGEELDAYLRAKLSEEVDELHRATSKSQIVDELADIFEVLETIARTAGITNDEVHVAKARKLKERGAFDNVILHEPYRGVPLPAASICEECRQIASIGGDLCPTCRSLNALR